VGFRVIRCLHLLPKFLQAKILFVGALLKPAHHLFPSCIISAGREKTKEQVPML
jgi:hypothetical protein